MKSIISTGIALAIGLSSVSGALAMEAMTGEAMMMKDAMVKEEGAMMMKDNSIVKTDAVMKGEAMVKASGQMTPSKIAAKYGYVWSRDKAKLAAAAGITNYRGTVKQNLAIRAYLKNKNMMMKDTMMKDEGAMMQK